MNFVFYYLPIIVAFVALAFAFIRAAWVAKQDAGNERMQMIGKWIADGAMAFLAREYKTLAIFVVAVAILLGLANHFTSDDTNAMIFV